MGSFPENLVDQICFQEVIPPTLSASNPTKVSGVKIGQSSNGWQTALFTELFLKNKVNSSLVFTCIFKMGS